MWSIDNRTPYAAGKSWGRDKDGVHQWIVSVKATFDLPADGRLRLCDEQPAPLLVPEYHGEPGLSSLRYDSELVAAKPGTDILVNGSAHAPQGRPSSEFVVGLQAGRVRKTLLVRGNRCWEKGAFGRRISRARPVTSVPLVYERAFGGYDASASDVREHCLDSRNPVGCGLTDAAVGPGELALPNFEYPGGRPAKDGPAGFGPLDAQWSPRRELMGTYDAAWQATRLPLLPNDWHPDSQMCAPADQRPSNPFWGGEPVELLNLSAGGVLRFTLPRIHLAFTTEIDGRVEEHRGRMASVIVEPDASRLMMVWTTTLAVRNEGDYLERTIVREKRGA